VKKDRDASLDVLAHATPVFCYVSRTYGSGLGGRPCPKRRFHPSRHRSGDHQSSPIWHGNAGVGHQIGEHTLKLGGSALTVRREGASCRSNTIFFSGETRMTVSAPAMIEFRLQINRLEALLAADGEQLLVSPAHCMGGGVYKPRGSAAWHQTR